MTEAESAWLAGIIEGEGCIDRNGNRNKVYVRLRVEMTDEDVISRCHTITNAGIVHYVPYKRKEHHSVTWRWSVHKADELKSILDAIYPWLGKRRQEKADWALSHL